MISDLKILNGNLELPFNIYTYEYTVRVEEDVNSLEFSYKLAEDTYVNIKNNELNDDENKVTLEVYDIDNSVTYTFYVYKNKTETTLGIDNYMKSLEVKKEEINILNVQLLAVSIFFILIVLFSIIFHKRKKKQK